MALTGNAYEVPVLGNSTIETGVLDHGGQAKVGSWKDLRHFLPPLVFCVVEIILKSIHILLPLVYSAPPPPSSFRGVMSPQLTSLAFPFSPLSTL